MNVAKSSDDAVDADDSVDCYSFSKVALWPLPKACDTHFLLSFEALPGDHVVLKPIFRDHNVGKAYGLLAVVAIASPILL